MHPSENDQNRVIRDTTNQLRAGAPLSDREYNQQQMAKLGTAQNRAKADFIPEVFFIGQIVGGTEFPTDQDGIFVEANLDYGDGWKVIDKSKTTMQTHTAYADDEGFYVFAHPFDFHFVCESIQGW